MSNSLAQQPKFSIAIRQKDWQDLINNTLGDPKRAARFVSAVSSAVGTTPALRECDAGSVLTAALLGETLNLAHSPQLGQYYLVPFDNKKTGIKKAQFVLGYKGYIQLAIRSGNYRKINVMEIKEGELISWNPFAEEIDLKYIEDADERDAAPTAGYYAMFEYVNGFRKAIYWSRKKMEQHADKYSPAFSLAAYRKLQRHEIPEKDLWKYSSFWYKNFDDMAKKTMIRQLISRWGVMSVEMQQAYTADNMEITHDGDGFVSVPVDDNPPEAPATLPPVEPEAEGIGEPMSLDDFNEE